MVMWSFPLGMIFPSNRKNMEIYSKGITENIPFVGLFIESMFPFDFFFVLYVCKIQSYQVG